MIKDTDFPRPIPPYRYPVPPVGVDPDELPLVQICVNESWLAYIIGALKSLALRATWATDDPTEVEALENQSQLLLAMFSEALEGCQQPPTQLCISGSFSDETYGFATPPTAPCDASWNFGDGFESCFSGSSPIGDYLIVQRIFDAETFIRNAHVKVGGIAAVTFTVTLTFFFHAAIVFTSSQSFSGSGSFDMAVDVNQQADVFLIEVNDSVILHTGDLKLFEWGVCYTGDFPLAEAPTTFTHVFDFTISDGGWTTETHPSYSNTGVYVPGVGWESQANVSGGVDSEVLILHRAFSVRSITAFTIEWNTAAAANGGFRGVQFNRSGSTVHTLSLNNGTGSFVETYAPFTDLDDIIAIPTTFGPGGSEPPCIITRIIITGVGTDPF